MGVQDLQLTYRNWIVLTKWRSEATMIVGSWVYVLSKMRIGFVHKLLPPKSHGLSSCLLNGHISGAISSFSDIPKCQKKMVLYPLESNQISPNILPIIQWLYTFPLLGSPWFTCQAWLPNGAALRRPLRVKPRVPRARRRGSCLGQFECWIMLDHWKSLRQ